MEVVTNNVSLSVEERFDADGEVKISINNSNIYLKEKDITVLINHLQKLIKI